MSLLPSIESSVRRRGAEPWLIGYDHLGQRSEWSYSRCHETALRLAGWLTRRGIGPGDRIAVLSRNRPEVYLAYLAAWLMGAVACPINVEERSSRKRFIVEHGRCVAVLYETECRDEVRDLAASVPALRHRLAFEELLEAVAGEPPLEPQVQPPDAGAFLVYTSGTTGDPKGVVLSHHNLQVNARATAAWHRFGPGDAIMTVLPIHHVNGAVVTGLTSFLSGGRNILLRSFSPRTFWQRCSAEGIVAASMVPTLLEYLLAADEDISAYDLERLRYLLCGAGPLLVDTVLRFEDRFGVAVCHGFGMSETTAYNTQFPMDMPATLRRGWYSRHGYPSAGCGLSCNEVTVLDSGGGEVRRLERGEIAIRGPTVMSGYLDDPAATARAFTADWFRSGDQGFYDVDAQGRRHLFITGAHQGADRSRGREPQPDRNRRGPERRSRRRLRAGNPIRKPLSGRRGGRLRGAASRVESVGAGNPSPMRRPGSRLPCAPRSWCSARRFPLPPPASRDAWRWLKRCRERWRPTGRYSFGKRDRRSGDALFTLVDAPCDGKAEVARL